MTNPCDAVWHSVVALWSAAALASFQPAEAQSETRAGVFADYDISSELDIDLVLAGGDLQARRDTPVVDARYRFEAERVLQSGQRWGVRAALAANSGDGRRGFSQTLSLGPQINGQGLSGLATGFVRAPGLDAGSGRVELSGAELYLKTRWLEWQLGWGQTAASHANDPPLTAFRLSRADRSIVDLAGGGLAHTGLSLSAPAPRLAVESRRILGISASASYTPDPQRCGVDICRPAETLDVISPDLSDVLAIAVSFDRRSPASGVRLQARAAFERAQLESALSQYDDPWIFSAHIAREHAGTTLSVSHLRSNDGFSVGHYEAWAATVSFEQGDWLYSAEIAHGDSEVFEIQGTSASIGGSRWIGDNTLFSLGLMSHEVGGVAGLIETGLRF